MNAAEYTVALRHALERAGFGYSITAYAIATLVLTDTATSVPGIAARLGISSKAVRDAAQRRWRHLFVFDWASSPTRLRLSQEGLEAMAKVARFLPRPTEKPRRPKPARGRIPNQLQLLLELQ